MSDSESFWSLIESKLACSVPKHIQNILSLNGYESAVSIKTITYDDITELQEFAQTSMKSRIPAGANLEDFYGPFQDQPEGFRFLSGHKKLLQEIVAFVKSKISTAGPEFFVLKPKRSNKQGTT